MEEAEEKTMMEMLAMMTEASVFVGNRAKTKKLRLQCLEVVVAKAAMFGGGSFGGDSFQRKHSRSNNFWR